MLFQCRQERSEQRQLGLFVKDACGRISEKVTVDVKRKLEAPTQVSPIKVSEENFNSQKFTLTFNDFDNAQSMIDQVILIDKTDGNNSITTTLTFDSEVNTMNFEFKYSIKESAIIFDTSLSILIYDKVFTINNTDIYMLNVGSSLSSLVLKHENAKYYENRLKCIIYNNIAVDFDINESDITFRSDTKFNEVGNVYLYTQDIVNGQESITQRVLITEQCENDSHTVIHPDSGTCVTCDVLGYLYYYDKTCVNACPVEAPYSENMICVSSCSEGFGFDNSNEQTKHTCFECTGSHHKLQDGICYVSTCVN